MALAGTWPLWLPKDGQLATALPICIGCVPAFEMPIPHHAQVHVSIVGFEMAGAGQSHGSQGKGRSDGWREGGGGGGEAGGMMM